MRYVDWKNNEKLFLIEDGREYSYHLLYCEINLLSEMLQRRYPQRMNFILEANNSFVIYSRFLALLALGHRVLLCSSKQYCDDSYIHKLKEEAQCDFILWSKASDIPDLNNSQNSPEAVVVNGDWESSAFIVRTSGSSGKKFKLVVHKPEFFYLKYKKIGAHFSRTYAFSPVDSIAGIETLLEVLTHELILVTGLDDLTVSKVVALMRKNNVDYFQTTPSFMNLMLVAGVVEKDSLGTLKKIAYGSEPSQQFVVDFFRQRLPDLEMMHTYGMSEIGIQKTLTDQENPTQFKLDERFNLYKITDGILEIQSLTKMISYLNDDEYSSGSDKSWFYTFDQVMSDGEFIKVLGRQGDLINIAGRKFFPSELEDLIRAMPEVYDVTVSAEKNDLIGAVITADIVIIHGLEETEFRKRFKSYCQNKIINYMHPHKVKIKDRLEILPRLKKMRNK